MHLIGCAMFFLILKSRLTIEVTRIIMDQIVRLCKYDVNFSSRFSTPSFPSRMRSEHLLLVLCLFTSSVLCQYDEGVLGQLWHNQAHLEFISTFSWSTPGEGPWTAGTSVGTYMVIVGDIWYLFYREWHPSWTLVNCKKIIVESPLILHVLFPYDR